MIWEALIMQQIVFLWVTIWKDVAAEIIYVSFTAM